MIQNKQLHTSEKISIIELVQDDMASQITLLQVAVENLTQILTPISIPVSPSVEDSCSQGAIYNDSPFCILVEQQLNKIKELRSSIENLTKNIQL